MNKTAQYAIRSGRVLSAMVAVIAVLMFIVVSFWGGFRVYFPFFTLSVTDPVRPFVVALVFGGLYEWLAHVWRSAGLAEDKAPIATPADAPPYRSQGRIILLVAALIGLRFVFKTYEPSLMGRNDGYALMVWVPLMVSGAALGAWRTALCAHRAAAGASGWFPVLFWILFPLAVPLHPLTALVFWVAAIVQPAAPGGWNPGRRRFAQIWGGVALLTVLVIVVLHSAGFGWAGKRVLAAISERTPLPVVWLLLCAFGMYAIRRLMPGLRLMVHRTGWLALLGIALAGARGAWGEAGVVLLLPLVAILLLAALLEIERRLEAVSMCFLHNILRLCLAGMLFGFIGLNLS